MPASASGLFYEANINRAIVDLALRVYSENPCLDHLQRLERETQEWIAILVEWRGTVEGQYAGLLDLALVMLRETGEKLRQQCGTPVNCFGRCSSGYSDHERHLKPRF
jgi:hypothetical protein